MIALSMFLVCLIMLAFGFPVAFTFGGVALFYGLYFEGLHLFLMVAERMHSIMTSVTLMAVPLFIFMGLILEKSGIAESMLESMGSLFGRIRGGLAVSTVIVGMLLAAATGVVGASVITMGLIALPIMLKYGYDKRLATGVICASGTLGQIIPPSIVLIIMGDVLQRPVGSFFRAALVPGLLLVVIYIIYCLILAWFRKEAAPPIPNKSGSLIKQYWHAFKTIIPALSLVIIVLGTVIIGIATPTESAAMGSVGAIILAMLNGKFKISMLHQVAMETTKITTMVFTILAGATFFSMVFTYTGGDEAAELLLPHLPGGKWGFILLMMLIIFLLGFFLDFVEIAYIFIPMITPLLIKLGIDPLWFGILVALNLQTSFLTPPVGFSLFYLRGVAPPSITTLDIYRGVIPFILLQILTLALVALYPGLIKLV
ncbi:MULTISPECIES: TRAP transporter large permease [Nitrosomonas]|uniref:TRAP transporter large permease protein n=2 Tax=Nitrosomonas eutropha TaxID=916 RepID=A0ABX5M9V4_9PROT|nr:MULTISPECIES: TRAP transporter large permease subunit [Nitrosomonas]ABI58958.1 TRAP dicarboxylate transporter, DctM subunit [Nitrosomonas eutropha C91]MXS79828.1 C4-dicarboxylate ABC transporter [Nitrosomonas sp. GH22]PXV82184.1 tripartite ATP-independent transporter DctM subunit [Nitrosomonas eutropha]SCX05350.1 TRAP transporter, DctM subunit [Nitrosomonas eutropha]SEI82143.1 TRAP transporter, DctM subunit [Nitrosomonas eutropha]